MAEKKSGRYPWNADLPFYKKVWKRLVIAWGRFLYRIGYLKDD